jgi:hypothetical protein
MFALSEPPACHISSWSDPATRNPARTEAVVHAVAHYTVAVGPMRPGRQDRVVAIIGETKDSSVFRWAGDEETVLRIAAEVGVGPDQIRWDSGRVDL